MAQLGARLHGMQEVTSSILVRSTNVILKESGITIHYVDEIYDHGNIIQQATCSIEENETPASLAQKIHQLEHKHYPEVISHLLQATNNS